MWDYLALFIKTGAIQEVKEDVWYVEAFLKFNWQEYSGGIPMLTDIWIFLKTINGFQL